MLKNILDSEDENTTEGFPKSVNPLVPVEAPNMVHNSDLTLSDQSLNFITRLFRTGNEVRVTKPDDKGIIWFVADDVCKILGYTKKTADVIKAHCQKVIDSKDLIDGETEMAHKAFIDTNGGKQAMIVITEPDVYRLVMRSRMPQARLFEKWIMEEVVPSVCHRGKYAVKRKIEFSNPEDQAKFEAAKTELSGQCELFPRMVPSVSLPADITDRLNSVKKRLFEQGHTFPNNKEFVKFLVNKALEDLEG